MNSMTGFGRAEGQVGASHFTIEIKSVNHRFLDVRFRQPSFLNQFEIPLAEALRSQCQRGAFEVHIKHKLLSTESSNRVFGSRFAIDELAAKSFMDCCEKLKSKYKLQGEPSLEMLAHNSRIVLAVDETQNLENVFEPVKAIFESAVKELKAARAKEGGKVKDILKAGMKELEKLGKEIEGHAVTQPEEIHKSLTEKLKQWKLTTPIDSTRLEWEVALMAEKADITEEIDRLHVHLAEFTQLLEGEGAIGRKLDFLTQELHRELNTLGVKSEITKMTQLTLEAKSRLEKLRQQVQNVE